MFFVSLKLLEAAGTVELSSASSTAPRLEMELGLGCLLSRVFNM